MRIEELKLIPPSKRSSAVLIEFMKEYEKGLKAIKTLAEIREIAERGLNCSQCSCGAKADLYYILQKINEVEDV